MPPSLIPHKDSAEDRIMAAATVLFASAGYSGVSTRDIALRAGVNEVTIYRHHPRKRDLYRAVLEAELKQVTLRGDLLARLVEAKDGSAALARTFELISETLSRRPALLRLLQFSILESSPDFEQLLRNYLAELVEVIARYLEPWIRDGARRGDGSRGVVLALVSFAACHGILHNIFQREDSDSEATFGAFSQFCHILTNRVESVYESAGAMPKEAASD